MNLRTLIYSLAILLSALNTNAHASLIIFQENFNGLSQYHTEGTGVGSNTDFFTQLPNTNLSLGFIPSNTANDPYFGGRDLNGFTSTGAHQLSFYNLDLSRYDNISLSISLAALDQHVYEANDQLTLSASHDGGKQYSTLDQFHGATYGALLSNGVEQLGRQFKTFTYHLNDIEQLSFRIEALSFNGTNEAFAFDSIKIQATEKQIGVPTPSSLLLCLGGLLLLIIQQKSRR